MSIDFILRLIHQLACHVFNFKLKALNTWKCICKFFFKIGLVICEFLNKFCTDFAGKVGVCYKADFSKDNYTVDVQRPLPFFAVALVINAEACLVVVFDGINFVAFLCAVKINLVVSCLLSFIS